MYKMTFCAYNSYQFCRMIIWPLHFCLQIHWRVTARLLFWNSVKIEQFY